MAQRPSLSAYCAVAGLVADEVRHLEVSLLCSSFQTSDQFPTKHVAQCPSLSAYGDVVGLVAAEVRYREASLLHS